VANIKSQIKRNKQNEKARLRNKAVKSELKTEIRKFREAVESGDVEARFFTRVHDLRVRHVRMRRKRVFLRLTRGARAPDRR
jgi:ribosomal protein S20